MDTRMKVEQALHLTNREAYEFDLRGTFYPSHSALFESLKQMVELHKEMRDRAEELAIESDRVCVMLQTLGVNGGAVARTQKLAKNTLHLTKDHRGSG